jgi:hypothetical protein
MTNKSKLIIIAAIASLGIASPAIAQSFDPDAGTGNVLAFGYTSPASGHRSIAVRRSGLEAYAMVPRTQSDPSIDNPALTGGGSPGYNDNLRKDY